jgi:Mlc titration factor MtfA (ptsG expression regulator)
MLLSWLKQRRRRRILGNPFPSAWRDYLQRNVAVYGLLSTGEQAQLRDDLRILVVEKNWEGCGGIEMTEEIMVTIAAQAALLLLGIEHDYYANVQSILVYPSAYEAPEDKELGIAGRGRLGEAWYRGPVVLAWDSVKSGGQDPADGRNVVFHEFAHQLDYLDGLADGTPPLRDQAQYRRWHKVMETEFNRLVIDAAEGRAQVLDEYGATNHAEFFAVATEAFFEKPVQLRQQHPEMYAVLKDYYCQDPAVWFERAGLVPPEEPPPSERRQHLEALRRPFRGSRGRKRRRKRVVRTEDLDLTVTWPGWVRFWALRSYLPRPEAVRRLGQISSYAAGFALIDVLAVFAFGRKSAGAGLIIGGLLTLLMALSALWLWLAIRWVDRSPYGWEGLPPTETPQESGGSVVQEEQTVGSSVDGQESGKDTPVREGG